MTLASQVETFSLYIPCLAQGSWDMQKNLSVAYQVGPLTGSCLLWMYDRSLENVLLTEVNLMLGSRDGNI